MWTALLILFLLVIVATCVLACAPLRRRLITAPILRAFRKVLPPMSTTERDAIARGLNTQRPFVGNRMWVTILTDPDGYKLDFESPTDAPEESLYSDPDSDTLATHQN